jgi:hypothetical protein
MKKYLVGLFVLSVFTFMVSIETNAQSCYKPRKNNRSYVNSNYNYNRASSNRNYNRNQRGSSFYRRHRNIINVGASTGAGALIGGLLGGNRKGMLKGAIVGGSAGALYTYVIKPKKRGYR